MNFLDSPPMRRAMSKLLLAFIFYTVAAASFNGFFVKWTFRDFGERYSFEKMYDGTAHRPFVHRQLMITVAKKIKSSMSEETQEKFIQRYANRMAIAGHYNTRIEPHYFIEYHIVYLMTFAFLFLSMFLIREIGIEVTKSPTAGTVAACTFAIIFPLFETCGGYFYDFGEIFFFSLATFFAVKGYWLALILIAPIAEYNKESFLFFIATLFPLLAAKLGNKKIFFALTAAIFLSGLVYLYVKSLYAGNLGGSTEIWLYGRLDEIFNGYTNTEITYGVFFGAGMFLPHILFIAWLIKCTWKKLSPTWKNHFKIAAAINIPLYIIFCYPNEIRNLSMLYISFIAMLSIFIKDLITAKGEDDFGTQG